MNSFRPKLEDLVTAIQADIASHLGLRLPLKKASILSALSYAMVGSLHLLYGRIESLMNEFTNPSHEFLDVFAFFFGLKRHEKTQASATVKFSGTAGKSIQKDALLSHANGRTYTLSDTVCISDYGTGYGKVTAEAPGPSGTLTIAETLTLVEAVASVSPSAQVLADNLQPGFNEEDDDALRSRLFSHLRHPGQGGSEADYKNWAKSIPGVGNVWVYAKEQQVFLTFLTTDANHPIPTYQHVEIVSSHILNQKPLGIRINVFALTGIPVKLEISSFPEMMSFIPRVETALKNYFLKELQPEKRVSLLILSQVISQVTRTGNFKITSPAADIDVGPGQIGIFGGLSWKTMQSF